MATAPRSPVWPRLVPLRCPRQRQSNRGTRKHLTAVAVPQRHKMSRDHQQLPTEAIATVATNQVGQLQSVGCGCVQSSPMGCQPISSGAPPAPLMFPASRLFSSNGSAVAMIQDRPQVSLQQQELGAVRSCPPRRCKQGGSPAQGLQRNSQGTNINTTPIPSWGQTPPTK